MKWFGLGYVKQFFRKQKETKIDLMILQYKIGCLSNYKCEYMKNKKENKMHMKTFIVNISTDSKSKEILFDH